jgi:O-antigen ligase
VIPVPGAWELNKSNGFFLLEPSHFSQMIGLAIVAEMAFFRPSWRLAILGLALLLSYSGTGLVVCALFVPLLLVRRGHGRLVILSLGGAFILFLFANLIHLTSLLDRVSEFDSERSSAFARFLSPFYLFRDVVFPHVQTTLFGLGPGSIEPYFNSMEYTAHDPTWGKLFFEYGIVGTVPFLIFICRCLFRGARSVSLSAAVFFTYLVLGGNLVDVRMEPLMLGLVAYQSRQKPAKATISTYRFQPSGSPL